MLWNEAIMVYSKAPSPPPVLPLEYIYFLFKVRSGFFSIIGLKNPKDQAADSRQKYDFQDKILAWRIELRKEK